jgi:hypothetical protein
MMYSEWQRGYVSGLKMGDTIGREAGMKQMLRQVIETIQLMSESEYATYTRDELASELWRELNTDEDD